MTLVIETLGGLFLLGSFFASFFSGPQRGSPTCTSSASKIRFNRRARTLNNWQKSNRASSVPEIKKNSSMSEQRKTLDTGEKIRAKVELSRKNRNFFGVGGMNNSNLQCLLGFIRSAFNYNVVFNGRIINNLSDSEILIIVDNALKNNKEELINIVNDIVENEKGRVGESEILEKIISIEKSIASGKGKRKLKKSRKIKSR